MDALDVIRHATKRAWAWLEHTVVRDITEEQANWSPTGTANTVGATYALGQGMRNWRGVPSQVAMRLATIVTVVGLFSAPLAVEAQQPRKVYRVGILTNNASDPAEVRLWQAFWSGLRERGWIEGQNILLEFRATEGNTARLPELAADLVRLKVDLIVARSSIFVQPAKEATSSIPIWSERAHRPFLCSAPQSSSLRDSAWLSWPLSAVSRRCPASRTS